MAKENKNHKISKRMLILSGIFILACLALLAGFAYAWFKVTETPQVDSSLLGVSATEHNGYQFLTLNNKELPDKQVIYPGDKYTFQIESIEDNEAFGIKIDITKLTDFSVAYPNRNDLTTGAYQIKETLRSDSGYVSRYRDFDIDSYLLSKGLNDASRQSAKYSFLEQFIDQNSILSAISLKIVKIGSQTCNILLEQVDDSDPIERSYFLDNDALAGYPNIPKGTILEMEFYYGYTNFYPLVNQYTFNGDAFLGELPKDYISLNYNCFIGQEVNLSFLNVK